MEIIGTVLLIEEKKCDREIFPILLRKIGFPSVVAESIDEAYSFLKSDLQNKPDIIVLSMETMTRECLDFIEWINNTYPEIKLLATSCRIEDEKSCGSLDANFVCKPITNFLKFKDNLISTLSRKAIG